MSAEEYIEKLVRHAEEIELSASRIEEELRAQIATLRRQQRQWRWVSAAVACLFALLIGGGFLITTMERAQLQSAICDTFRDVASSPTSPQTSDLGRKLVLDTRRGAEVARCPQHRHLLVP